MICNARRTYLDAAAGWNGNASSPHAEGRAAKKKLEDARTSIARLLEVQADDVIFTSGATESNALAILGVVRSRQKAEGSKKLHALYLPSAHASVVENMKLLAEEGVEIVELPIRGTRVDVETLAKMLRPETVLLSMDAVCGETGVVWNTREVAETIRGFRKSPVWGFTKPPFLHIDASQAPLTEKVTRSHFGADLLALDGSKIGVPRGIGVLVARRTLPAGRSIAPLYRGGGQEHGVRPGSEAAELAEGCATCLRQAAHNRNSFRARAETDRAALVKKIMNAIPGIYINEGCTQVPSILNISLPGRDTDYLVALLDEAGFAVSTKSACETDSEHGSRAVLALTGDAERAKATLRISWHAGIRARDLRRFAAALIRAVAFVDSHSSG